MKRLELGPKGLKAWRLDVWCLALEESGEKCWALVFLYSIVLLVGDWCFWAGRSCSRC
jgi:hypothetical protein